jgi:hypothetical protein
LFPIEDVLDFVELQKNGAPFVAGERISYRGDGETSDQPDGARDKESA